MNMLFLLQVGWYSNCLTLFLQENISYHCGKDGTSHAQHIFITGFLNFCLMLILKIWFFINWQYLWLIVFLDFDHSIETVKINEQK